MLSLLMISFIFIHILVMTIKIYINFSIYTHTTSTQGLFTYNEHRPFNIYVLMKLSNSLLKLVVIKL